MHKLRKLALIPVIVGVLLISAAPAFADFVCPVLRYQARPTTMLMRASLILPGNAGSPGNSPVDVPDHATNGNGSGNPGGTHAVPGDSSYTAIWNN